MYAYNKDKSAYTGGAYHNLLLAAGALTVMQHDLLE